MLAKSWLLVFAAAQLVLANAVPLAEFSAYLRSGHEAHENLNKLKIIIYETGPYSTSLETFMNVAEKYGVESVVVGQGSEFEGFGSKYGQLKDSLDELKDDPQALVAVIDGRDVLLNVNHDVDRNTFQLRVNQFIDTFKEMVTGKPRAVLMSAEQQCCVAALCHADSPSFYFDPDSGKRAQRACPSGEEGCGWLDNENVKFWQSLMVAEAYSNTGSREISPYLNAGLMVGTAQNLIDLIERIDLGNEEDDQAVLSAMYLQFPELVVLDYEQKLLGNNAWPKGLEEGCIYDFDEQNEEKSHLTNTQTGTAPLIVHTPGKFYNCLDTLIDRLGGVSDMRYLNEEDRAQRKLQKNYGVVTNYGLVDTSAPQKNYGVVTNYGLIDTSTPTASPTASPTTSPTSAPTTSPTASPTSTPTDAPIGEPGAIADLTRDFAGPSEDEEEPSNNGALTWGLSCAAAGILIAGLATRKRQTMTIEQHANAQKALDDSDEVFSIADPRFQDDMPSVISSAVDESADPDAMELQAMSHQPFNSSDEQGLVDVAFDEDQHQIKSILSAPFDACDDICGRTEIGASEDLRRHRSVHW
jgi:hypothetical protein